MMIDDKGVFHVNDDGEHKIIDARGLSLAYIKEYLVPRSPAFSGGGVLDADGRNVSQWNMWRAPKGTLSKKPAPGQRAKIRRHLEWSRRRVMNGLSSVWDRKLSQ
ncbi:hypothetical protein Micbo1qcDRAFT_175414 [Microdochium bolleyi]|uniref:Uncharacterized protein n=1 Tax=Microdochium bolleyi TaxID=196109 RepID=A0A136J5Q7_9PEZI|nr:hypothetical protein Micbo1qcDRAFT_175414 [Microdochium bolleyi]